MFELISVFLGGACNPTTWRKDVAIPFLEENHIPYFNPVCVFILLIITCILIPYLSLYIFLGV